MKSGKNNGDVLQRPEIPVRRETTIADVIQTLFYAVNPPYLKVLYQQIQPRVKNTFVKSYVVADVDYVV